MLHLRNPYYGMNAQERAAFHRGFFSTIQSEDSSRPERSQGFAATDCDAKRPPKPSRFS
jgi:hypothetical protein